MDERIKKEYEKLKALFNDIDEDQLRLVDGALVETARLKIELDDLQEIVKSTGVILVSAKNPFMQKELPVAKQLAKSRASYLNYIYKLSGLLGKKIDDDEDDLSDFE